MIHCSKKWLALARLLRGAQMAFERSTEQSLSPDQRREHPYPTHYARASSTVNPIRPSSGRAVNSSLIACCNVMLPGADK